MAKKKTRKSKKSKAKIADQVPKRIVTSPFVWAVNLFVAIPPALIVEADNKLNATSAWFLGIAGLLATPIYLRFGWIDRIEKRTKKGQQQFARRLARWRRRAHAPMRTIVLLLFIASLAMMFAAFAAVRWIIDPSASDTIERFQAIFLVGFLGIYMTVLLGFVVILLQDELDEDAPVKYLGSSAAITAVAESEIARLATLGYFVVGTILAFTDAYLPPS